MSAERAADETPVLTPPALMPEANPGFVNTFVTDPSAFLKPPSPFEYTPPADHQAHLEAIQMAGELVMHHIPGPEARQIDPKLVSVMSHELGHSVVALMKYYNGEFTARPGVDAAGQPYAGLTTIYAENIPPEDLAPIAAGGFAAGGDGYGSDFTIIKSLHSNNGPSLEAAKTEARLILAVYKDALFARAAHIAAYIQEFFNLDAIPFAMIPAIFQRAMMELDIEAKKDQSDRVDRQIRPFGQEERNTLVRLIKQLLLQPGSYRQINDRADGSQYTAEVRGHILVDYYRSCPICGASDMNHRFDCPVAQKVKN